MYIASILPGAILSDQLWIVTNDKVPKRDHRSIGWWCCVIEVRLVSDENIHKDGGLLVHARRRTVVAKALSNGQHADSFFLSWRR